MKTKIILGLVLSSITTIAQTDVSVECYYTFTDTTIEITPKMSINSCTADFVWGFDNVCFRGDTQELVQLMNNDYFRWGHSLRVYDAQVVTENLIEYTGVDAQNFYSGRFDLTRCEEN